MFSINIDQENDNIILISKGENQKLAITCANAEEAKAQMDKLIYEFMMN